MNDVAGLAGFVSTTRVWDRQSSREREPDLSIPERWLGADMVDAARRRSNYIIVAGKIGDEDRLGPCRILVRAAVGHRLTAAGLFFR
ncbi:hypothetical protein NKH47_22825 [Mesorhizobium sp. M1060]|uniref:hypothetical protein n=1 Tax=Mesorhizobium sp. L2C089B000 TaxID=1287120 RepID=UPI0003D053F4|nr:MULTISPECIES: hypothetical protein [unclassified Mesorhizobium]ESZ02743.1 hypothetical protein X736_29660 [Mesorhizobium sp. L2C089B000]WJI50610.1 hypothetical protein NLY44_29660 [Mesorhizobium sp. C089B]